MTVSPSLLRGGNIHKYPYNSSISLLGLARPASSQQHQQPAASQLAASSQPAKPAASRPAASNITAEI
eukprot:1043255-Heterocapsa_arctica.AAC.1